MTEYQICNALMYWAYEYQPLLDANLRAAIREALELIKKKDPPKGHWIVRKVKHRYSELDKLECSNCGYIHNSSLRRINYCENCGARMDGEEDAAD